MADYKFQNPAVYKIKISGAINESWSERLGGMQINVEQSKSSNPVTILIGKINDQAALSGVLNTLYENHLSIISVNMLDEKP
jgi:uncharacterized DUF497 family protein